MAWFLRILQLARLVSPELKEEIKRMVTELEAAAKKTKLPIDDSAVAVLKLGLMIVGLL